MCIIPEHHNYWQTYCTVLLALTLCRYHSLHIFFLNSFLYSTLVLSFMHRSFHFCMASHSMKIIHFSNGLPLALWVFLYIPCVCVCFSRVYFQQWNCWLNRTLNITKSSPMQLSQFTLISKRHLGSNCSTSPWKDFLIDMKVF